MKSFLRLFGFCSLLASVIPVAPAAPVTIMFVGDSLTQNDPGYRGPLAEKLRAAGHEVRFVGRKAGITNHEGHGGFTIGPGPSKADDWSGGKGNIHAQLDDMLAKNQPDILLLLVGVNDFFNIQKDRDPEYDVNRTGPARLAGVLDKIHLLSPKTRVIYSSILPVGWDPGFAKKYNAQLPALRESRPFAIFADLAAAVCFTKGDWSPDNVHLSKSGDEKLAKAWFIALEPLL